MESLNEARHVFVLPLLLVHGDRQVGFLHRHVEFFRLLESPLLLQLLSLGDVHAANLKKIIEIPKIVLLYVGTFNSVIIITRLCETRASPLSLSRARLAADCLAQSSRNFLFEFKGLVANWLQMFRFLGFKGTPMSIGGF